MSRGRPRIPTNLHILHGNPGKRPLNDAEPQPEVKIPEPPPIIKGVALEEWNRVAPCLLSLGLISDLSRSCLAGYCLAFARWIEAEEKYAEGPKIYKTESGYPIVDPWRGVADKALEQMHKFARGFGLDPESMTRIKGNAVPKLYEKPTGAARFLA